jgi:hypothetical protein
VYVRWKKQCRRPAWAPPGTMIDALGKTTILGAQGVVTYRAQLVESSRDAGGKPRQHIVAHLATIPEYALEDGPARAAFWDACLRKLHPIPLSKEQRERLIHSITAQVPFPTRRAQAEYLRHRGQKGNSVYSLHTRDGFRTVVRSRPQAQQAQQARQDRM